jgi:hypothetical protein
MSWKPRRFVQAARDGGLGHDDPTLLMCDLGWIDFDFSGPKRGLRFHTTEAGRAQIRAAEAAMGARAA